MKRDPSLVTLSRDHHQALVVAQILRRASGATADAAWVHYERFWQEHGQPHFRVEEEVLLPAYAQYAGAEDPAIARTLREHVAIRAATEQLAAAAERDADALAALGSALADHVRFEERELFTAIEQALPAAALTELAAAIDAAEAS